MFVYFYFKLLHKPADHMEIVFKTLIHGRTGKSIHTLPSYKVASFPKYQEFFFIFKHFNFATFVYGTVCHWLASLEEQKV